MKPDPVVYRQSRAPLARLQTTINAADAAHPTMTAIKTFDFAPGMSLRTVAADGEPWFIAKDVCDALDIKNTAQAIAEVDPDDKHMQGIGLPGRAPWLVNESGLYSLIFRSQKPEAQKFRRWVTRDVLPAIRSGGMYYRGQEKVDLASMSFAEAQQHIEELKAKVAEAEAIRWAKSREEKQARRDAFKFLKRRG